MYYVKSRDRCYTSETDDHLCRSIIPVITVILVIPFIIFITIILIISLISFITVIFIISVITFYSLYFIYKGVVVRWF